MRLSSLLRKNLRLPLAILLAATCTPLLAQSNLATLNGTVVDPQKRPVLSAQIELKSASTGAMRSALSNAAGIYELAGLVPGDYELRVAAPGFALFRTSVHLEVGQRMTLDPRLQLTEHNEMIDVVAAAETLKTTDTSVGDVIEPKSINSLPLNGRMLIDLVLTVPGAHISHGAQTGDMNPLYWRPGQRSAVSIAGSRPNGNYFLLDGTSNTDPTFNTENLSLSPDAVQEFQVQTGSYSAEMGGAGGGQINIITRTGSSQYHGTVYDFTRNRLFDARAFNEMDQNSRLVQNQFGASFGGPVPLLKKMFFFSNYEGFRMVQNMTMTDTVPTAAEAGGDFSNAGAQIFDPFSSRTNPNFDAARPVSPGNPKILRDPFPDNIIPQPRISSVASTMLNQYTPQPNLMGDMGMGMTMMGQPTVFGNGADSNNYMDVRAMRHQNDQGTMRIDRVFDNGDSLTTRYTISQEEGFMPQNLPGFGAFHDNRSQHAVVMWTHVPSANVVNVASVSMSRLSMHRYSENNFSNDIISELGIQGVGFGGYGAYGAPWFAVQGYSGFGDSFSATPVQDWDTVLEGRDALSWQRGRHSLKFGGSFRYYIWPMWGFFQNRGFYQFTNGFTTGTATNDGTGSALASFLLGLPAVRQRQAGIPSMDLRQWYADGFAQDTWRITTATTLTLGIRYEYMAPLWDIARPWSNLVPQDGKLNVYIGGQNGMPRGLLHTNTHDFAPRLGIAHNIAGAGLVLRAAYGIFYTPVDMNTWCNQLHNPPLVFSETNQSDNFVPSINGFDFAPPVLGKTVVGYNAFDAHAPAQYIQQWSASVEKSLGRQTTLEAGYLGARGFHLQRAYLINNAPPGPGLLQPRRPYQTASFVPGTVFPDTITIASTTFPVSSVNILQNTARSWYDAGYLNLRRRYAHGLNLLANYTFSKNLSDAPDFRSPMFESALAQNNADLRSEKGLACDVRHRFSLSAVYDVPALGRWALSRAATRGWTLSTLYQVQTGFPLTVSVFGDTANAGTILGENPVRANYTGQPVFGPGTQTAGRWFNPAAFVAPPAYTFGNVGRNTVTGPGLQSLDFALTRDFAVAESVRFNLRGEFYNALNQTNLGTPNRFVNTPQFGTITEAATPGRQIQLSARFSF